MPLLAYCGQAIRSELPLPELPPSTLAAPDIRVGLRPSRQPTGTDWEEDESNWFPHQRGPSHIRVRFPDFCDFVLSEESRRIDCEPHPGCDAGSLRHLLLDLVLPLALAQSGKLILHASAAAVDGGCVAFLGSSGAGKSTLNAFFCSQGFSAIADDCLVIDERPDGAYGVPSYPALRLWPDAAPLLEGFPASVRPMAAWGTKQVFSLDPTDSRFCSGPVPVRAIYILQPQDLDQPHHAGHQIVPLPPRDSLVALTRHLFHLDRGHPHLHAAMFDRLGNLAATVPVRALTFARDFRRLPELAKSIVDDLCSLPGAR